MAKKELEIYVNFKGSDIYVGLLFVENVRGKEIYSFKFDSNYIKSKNNNLIIDPELMFIDGIQYKKDSSSLYGFLQDTLPDRWGRMIIKKYFKDRSPLLESDFLLLVNDYTREGAIRIKERGAKQFSYSKDKKIPSFLNIKEISNSIACLDKVNNDEIKDLLYPGSSLGGARPKAVLFNSKNELYLAKFPSPNDSYDVELEEKKANDFALKCGLNVTINQLIKDNNNQSIFLSKRFDRDEKGNRVPFVSMMTLLGAKDGDSSSFSYLNMLDVINQYSVKPKEDSKELFKRLIFNILIHNADDHLRNHALIYKDKGWELSPLYDINPNNGKYLSLSIDGHCYDFDLNKAISTSLYYGIKKEEALKIVEQMKGIINK